MEWKFVRKLLSFFLAWLMVNLSGPPSLLAKSDSAKDNRRAEEVKAAVLKLGTGKDARVMVILRDSGTVRGYVHQSQEDGFSVSNFCSGVVIPVPFAQVRGLRGVNVATGTKVSTGKGVSKEVDAVLAADEPCGTAIIEAKSPSSGHLRTIVVVAAIATLVAVVTVIAIWVAQEHSQ
jgi:hypothetical protein